MENQTLSKKCPFCGKDNIVNTTKCDCGYYFDEELYKKNNNPQEDFHHQTKINSKCDNCVKINSKLHQHQFFVGKKMGYENETIGYYNLHKDHFEVMQTPQRSYICSKCIAKCRLKHFLFLIPFLFLFGYMIYLIFYSYNNRPDGLYLLWILCGIIVFAPLLTLLSLIFRTNNDIGDELAKYSFYPIYRQLGFDAFFTTEEKVNLSRNYLEDDIVTKLFSSIFDSFTKGILKDRKNSKDKKAEKIFNLLINKKCPKCTNQIEIREENILLQLSLLSQSNLNDLEINFNNLKIDILYCSHCGYQSNLINDLHSDIKK